MPLIREELRRDLFKRAFFSTAIFLGIYIVCAIPFAPNVGGALALALACGFFTVGVPFVLMRQNRFHLAATIFIAGGSTPVMIAFWYGESVYSPAGIAELGFVFQAAMLLERNRALTIAILFLIANFAKVVVERMGVQIPVYFPNTPYTTTAMMTCVIGWVAPVLFLANDTLNRTLTKLQERLTELSEANTRLLNSEQLRQSITETAPVGILVFDKDGRNVFANSFAISRLGEEVRWSSLDRLPWPITDHAGEPIPVHQQPFRQVASTHRAIYSSNLAIERPPGRRIYLSVSAAPLGPAGEGIVVAFEDVSSRLEMERRHVHSQRLASMGQLAGSIAHDFNNFLTVIRGDSQLALANAPPDPSLRTRLERIYKTSDQAAAVCRQLLAFARRDEAIPQLFSVNNLIEENAGTLRSLLPQNVELTLDLTPQTPLIMGEPILMVQVLMNLTLNARDAMPDGGRFLIQTLALENALMLIVEDTGAGMDDATLNTLFEPYFTTKPAGRGTGLGLAIVYGVVQQFGGWIRVESEIGKGTRFLIRLPAAAIAATQDR